MINTIKRNNTVSYTHQPASEKDKIILRAYIRKHLIRSITLYRKGQISLDTLSEIAGDIKESHSDVLSKSLTDIIRELSSLQVINDMLTEIVTDLTSKKTKE